MTDTMLTGKPSIDKPWMKYYPPALMQQLRATHFTLSEYLHLNCPGLDVPAIHYYGTEITWGELFNLTNRIAKSLRALGVRRGDKIPVLLQSVPEFIPLLLAAEKIGACLLCRDNEIHENAQAIRDAGAKIMFVHSFMTQAALDEYMDTTNVSMCILVDPCENCSTQDMPDYIVKNLDSLYQRKCAGGDDTMSWREFLNMGDYYEGPVKVPADCMRPVYCCYTSGSTGPSKQVVHSAYSMLGNLVQMNFYGAADVRPTWLHTILPPALVSVVIAMLLLPLSSNKLLILDPWVAPEDIDLELMRYQPNNWPMIPMFMDILVNSDRIPADYDISHIVALGAGAEACNNTQLKRINQFLLDHKSQIQFSTAFGSSESGSLTFHISGRPTGNCNVGCPMPLTTVSIFKPGTTEELGYNEIGEICVCSPGLMMGYDNPEATARVLKVHKDNQLWYHMGDMGYMDEGGHIFTVGRGTSPRYGGGNLDILPMENRLADANIPGIVDQFFVNIPDPDHEGCFLPYLYVVLKEGYSTNRIRRAVNSALKPYMRPVEIIQLPTRPYWHFKTNRIGLINEVLAARSAKTR